MNKSKRSKKYSTTLKRHNDSSINKNGLYYINSKNGFSLREPLDVKIDGITVKTYLGLFEDLQEEHRDLHTFINTQNKALTEFLISKGLITPKVNLDALIGELSSLLVIIPNKEYDLLQKDSNGYITSKSNISGNIITRPTDYPVDLLHGYYKYENNKLVVDEVKKKELLSGGLF